MNLVTVVEDLLTGSPRCGSTHVIAIDGRAGAGKTTLANELFLALSSNRKVSVVHLDDIYAGWELALTDMLTASLSQIIKSISAGESVTFPIYDWTWQQFDSTREISPSDLIIIEGVGSGQRIVREVATATIWIDIDQKTGLERVLGRDGFAIVDQMNTWQEREEKHFLSDRTRENADFILSTT
jgi:uridine kinase